MNKKDWIRILLIVVLLIVTISGSTFWAVMLEKHDSLTMRLIAVPMMLVILATGDVLIVYQLTKNDPHNF